MKLTAGLILFSIITATAASTYSQTARISLYLKESTILEIFREIERTSEFGFFFKSEEFDLNKKKSVQINNALIDEVLKEVLDDNYSYKILDKNIVVTKRSQEPAQQGKTINGKVTDSNGQPLPGVSVVVKGTSTGAVSDVNGEFGFAVPADARVLVLTFVGMKTREVSIEGKTTISVAMDEETIGLAEVVAIGYGKMKKSDLTGAVVSVDMTKKTMAANVTLSQALQGHSAGVNVGASGKAGEEGSLSIRGRTSLSATDNPLIVLDGVIFNGNTTDIDVNDIENVDILKDASAAAVYGSRSANGVIIITTRRGKTEKPTFNFNMYYGFQDISNTQRTNIMNGDEYAVRMVDYFYQQTLNNWYKTKPTDATNRPVRPDITDRTLVSKSLRSAEEQANYLAGNEIDWVNAVTQAAPIQNYNFSVSGKTDRTNYFLSSSYTNQKGVMINDKFERPTLRANFENKITDWFTFGLNSSYSHLDYSGLNDEYLEDGTNYAGMYLALIASPLANMYNANNIYPTVLTNETYQRHPLGNTLVNDVQIQDNLFLVLSAKIDIPKIKGLRYEVNYSNTFNVSKRNKFYPATTFEGATNNGQAYKNLREERNWQINNIVSYSRTLAEKHSVYATLLYSRENLKGEASNLSANNFPNPVLGFNAMQLGQNLSLSSDAWSQGSISYMGRINYIYDNRYLATATFRRDGFSGFGSNGKYADFPSASLGWVVSEESFLKDRQWLDYLKFRVSYGVNGNQGIGRYSSLAKMGTAAYTFSGAPAIGVFPNSLGNSNLGWEKTKSFNIGMDFKCLNQRVSAEIDVYNAQTSDILVKRSLPATTGYANVWTNIGEINNKGIEAGLTTVNFKSPSFKWETRLQFAMNRDKITKLYGGDDLGNSWFVGKPISSIYNYQVVGVWQESDLFEGTILANYYPGQYKLKDLNEDGKITAANDRSIIGYGTPNYRFSVTNSFSYKGLALNIFVNSIQGGDGYYMSNNYDAVVAGGTDMSYRINRSAVRPYWRPDNAVNNAPGMYYSPSVGHGVYESRSFVRLQDVSLSYDFGKKTLGFDNLQIYISGKNLYTWTKWSGWDPEISVNAPLMRSIISGIRLSF